MSPQRGRRPEPARPPRPGGKRTGVQARFARWEDTANDWVRWLRQVPRWGCSTATRGRIRADYAMAGIGKRRGRPSSKAHHPRWVVLGWQHGRLVRVVVGFWCHAYSLDGRLSTTIPDGFTVCRGCQEAGGRKPA
jgi:hypothetical protein